MARTKEEIRTQLYAAFMASEILAVAYGFPVGVLFDAVFSLVSFEKVFFEIVIDALFIQSQQYDQHTTEINDLLINQKSGRPQWWVYMAKNFQMGRSLVTDKDYYNNTGYSPEEIEALKIVKYAAVFEPKDESRVILKIATEVNGKLAPLTAEQYQAFAAYVDEWNWCGVDYTIINYLPDKLYLTIEIKYDPQILSAAGQSILNANFPVNDALTAYMKMLPFDGSLKLITLEDQLQTVPGVLDFVVKSAQSSWINDDGTNYGVPQEIYMSKVPESGYFEIETFDTIAYVVQDSH